MSNGTEYYRDMDILKLIEERLKYGNEYFYNKESGNYGDIYGTEIEIPHYDNRYFNSYRK